MATSTIKSSGGNYTSLVSWEAAKQADITGLGPEVAECYNFSLTETVTLNGWTTTASDYIRVYTPTAERHAGNATSGFKLTGGGSDDAFRIAEQFVRVEGLIVVGTGNFFGISDVGIPDDTGEVRVSYNIVYSNAATSTGRGIAINHGVSKVWNNIVYDFGGGASVGYGISQNGSGATMYAYNNTVYGCRFGIINLAGTFTPKNNIVDGPRGTGAACYNGTFTNETNDLASDTTAGGTNPQDSKAPVYVDEGSAGARDLRITSSDTDAKDQGADLSADGNIAVTDDIVGTARPQNSTYDIGAFEVVAAAGDPEGRFIGGKLIHGGLLMGGVLVR